MPKKINWGKDEDFISKYKQLKSSRKMGQLYNCDKTSVLNHAKKIGFDVNSINRQYKLTEKDKDYIIKNYNTKTSTELASELKVSRGMITKVWYDNNLTGKKNISQKTTQIDITGQTFGKWKVLYKTDKRSSNGGIYWHCKCECGNEKDVLSTSLRSGKSLSCGLHSNISRGNVKIAELLTKAKIPFKTEYKFATCKDKKELPFDFYVDNKYLIEYDGEQHFKKDNIFDYEYTHKHDLIKNQWCKENNIPLIRIPYTHFNNITLNDLILETSHFINN